MALPITVTYTFGGQTSAIPLSYLDSNFTTVVNGVNGIGNGANALSNVAITGGSITGITDLAVADGGTGRSSLTAYAVLAGGTTNTGGIQSIAVGTAGQVLMSNGAGALASMQSQSLSITYVVDGGGNTVATGVAGDLIVPFAATIQDVTLLADQSGNVVIDIWKAPLASYPPTSANSIVGNAKPTITSNTYSQSSTLTGWTANISANDTLRYNVDSAANISRVTISLKCIRTSA